MIALWWLVACDGGGGDSTHTGGPCTDPCGCDGATLEVGGTDYDDDGRPVWVEMPEGSEQTMVHGPQGGWHVLAAARVRGTAEVVTLVYTINYPEKDAQLSAGTFKVMLVADDECGGYYPAMFGILDVSAIAEGEANTPPELLAGKNLRLSMTVDDGAGGEATDDVTVVAALDPMDAAD